tara:strand:- start:8899 stop:10230 length:1332 start_codon:yes stop_codon:yes gene_type:complete
MTSIIITTIISLLLSTITFTDNTLLEESHYFKSAEEIIDSLSTNVQIKNAKYFKAGWAKTNITPSYRLPLGGYGARKGAYVSEVLDSVWARGFVFDDGFNKYAIITLDALIVPPAVTKKLQFLLPEIGYDLSKIYLSATHTHCSMGGWADSWLGYQFAGEFNQQIVDDLANSIIITIKNAEKELSNAKIGFGSYDAGQFVRNRLVGNKGTTDPWFRLIKIQKEDGSIGLITSFAAHATVFSHRQMKYSRDYPGVLVDSLEHINKIEIAAFCAGAVGSHSPNVNGSDSYEKIANLSSGLYTLARENIDSIQMKTVNSMGSLLFDIPLREPHFRISQKLRIRPWLFNSLTEQSKSYLSILKIGDIILTGTPCDFSGELINNIETNANRLNHNIMVTSFNGGYIGYITNDKWYNIKGYETFTMNWFGPYNGSYFVYLINNLMEILI